MDSGYVDINAAGAVNIQGNIVTTGGNSNTTTAGDGGNVMIDNTLNTALVIIGGNITTSGGNTTVVGANNSGFNAGNAGLIQITTNRTSNDAITLQNVTFTSSGGSPIAPGVRGVGGNQTFTGNVMFDTAGANTFDTGLTQGTVRFNNLLNADANQALNISVGEGAVKFVGAVGQVSPLGLVTITNANNIDADNAFASAGITATALTATTPVSQSSTLMAQSHLLELSI